jgi:transposase
MILGLAASAKNSDWTQEQYASAILASTSRAGDKIRHRRDRDAYIARCWDMAELLISTSRPSMSAKDREQAREYLTMVGIAAGHHPWRGGSGASDRTVLRTHLLHAWGLGRIVYDLDVRTVSVVSHLSKSTVVTAQRRLRRAGWLLLVRPSRGPHAASWAVLPQFARQAKSEPTRTHSIAGGHVNVCSTEFAPVDLGHDTWARAGLGKSTARVYEHLHATEAIASTILAKILGIGLRMVQKHLGKLRRHGLAVTDGRGGWLRGPADPAAVAETLGTAGLRQGRWQQALGERQAHRTHLATRPIRRMPYDDGADAVREIPGDAADGSPDAVCALAHGSTVDARPVALSTSAGMVGAARSRDGDPDAGGLVGEGVERP